jgi:hypothetical protein
VARFEHEGEQLVSQVAAGYGTEPDVEVRADLSRLSGALRGRENPLGWSPRNLSISLILSKSSDSGLQIAGAENVALLTIRYVRFQ